MNWTLTAILVCICASVGFAADVAGAGTSTAVFVSGGLMFALLLVCDLMGWV